MIVERSHPSGHVLVSFPAEEAARQVLPTFAREGIPVESLRVEYRMAPLRVPRRLAPVVALVALVLGAVAGAVLVAADRVSGAGVFAAYSGMAGALGGSLLDARRRARFDRRRAARERSGYVVVCPPDVLADLD